MEELTISKLPSDWYEPGKYTKLRDILKDIYNKIEILDEKMRLTDLGTTTKTSTEQELWDLNKAEQITLLNSYGITDIPQYEAERVAKLLEVQNG